MIVNIPELDHTSPDDNPVVDVGILAKLIVLYVAEAFVEKDKTPSP